MKKIIVLFLLFVVCWAGKNYQYKGFSVKQLEKTLVCIPKGNLMFSDSLGYFDGQKMIHDTIKRKVKSVPVDSFYMCSHELCNAEYLDFINDIKLTDSAHYLKMLPDTLVWINKHSYNEPYVKYYFRHPAYGNYPVVGITHAQAEYYCKWLTSKYMKNKKRKFKNIEFKLPTFYEWEYAATGGQSNTTFPWSGRSMMNEKGQWRANFMPVDQSVMIKVDKRADMNKKEYAVITSDFPIGNDVPPSAQSSDVTTPVESYAPNLYGLYNMAGNVKEYVREEGITKGGSWRDMGYYLQNFVEQTYDSASYRSSDTGFRIVMEIKK